MCCLASELYITHAPKSLHFSNNNNHISLSELTDVNSAILGYTLDKVYVIFILYTKGENVLFNLRELFLSYFFPRK